MENNGIFQLSEAGYRHLHIVDGSKAMMKQALELNVYEDSRNEVVDKKGRSSFLEETGTNLELLTSRVIK